MKTSRRLSILVCSQLSQVLKTPFVHFLCCCRGCQVIFTASSILSSIPTAIFKATDKTITAEYILKYWKYDKASERITLSRSRSVAFHKSAFKMIRDHRIPRMNHKHLSTKVWSLLFGNAINLNNYNFLKWHLVPKLLYFALINLQSCNRTV